MTLTKATETVAMTTNFYGTTETAQGTRNSSGAEPGEGRSGGTAPKYWAFPEFLRLIDLMIKGHGCIA